MSSNHIEEGLICVLSTLEPCRTFSFRPEKGKPFVLLGIFWIFLEKYLGSVYSVATWQDNTHLILPLFAHVSKSFAAGEFPYWINSIAGGIPLYNTPQFSILY